MMSTIDAFFKHPSKALEKKPVIENRTKGCDKDTKDSVDLNDSIEEFQVSKLAKPIEAKTYAKPKHKRERESKKKSKGKSDDDPVVKNESPSERKDVRNGQPGKAEDSKVAYMTYEDFIKDTSADGKESKKSKKKKKNKIDENLNIDFDKCKIAEDELQGTDQENSSEHSQQESKSTPQAKSEAPNTVECKSLSSTDYVDDTTREKSSKKKAKKRIQLVTLKRFDDTSSPPILENNEGDEDESTLPAKPPQNNSLFQYFARCDKPKVATKTDEASKPVQITAEIHKEPSPSQDKKSPPKMFDIFSKSSKKYKLPEDQLKGTPNSNVIVGNENSALSIDILETSIDVSPVKKRKKVSKCLIIEKATDSDSMINDDVSNILIKQLSRGFDVPEGTTSIIVSSDEESGDKAAAPTKNSTVESSGEDAALAQLERKKTVTAQMELLDKIKMPSTKKSTQATLSFTKTGFSVQKPVTPREPIASEPATQVKTPSPVASTAKESAFIDEEASNQSDSTRGSPSTGRGKKRKRTALESIYKSSLVKSSSKKRGPLVMKLRRLRSNEEDENEVLKKTQAKAKAQELVQKAKKSRSKAVVVSKRLSKGASPPNKKKKPRTAKTPPKHSPDSSSTPDGANLRRSSRRSAHLARETISLQYEDSATKKNRSNPSSSGEKDSSAIEIEESPSIEKKQDSQQKKKETKKGGSKQNKKAKVALAPIFRKTRQESTDTVVSVSSGTDDVEITAVEVDPAKKAFLMSGVPAALKKQSEAFENKLYDYPPIPAINHVQQKMAPPETGLNPWSLQPALLPMKTYLSGDIPQSVLESVTWSRINCCDKDQRDRKTKLETPPEKIAEEMIKYLLAEINSSNSLFPVRRMYRQLLYRRQENMKDDELQKTDASETDQTNDGKIVPNDDQASGDAKGRKKRKASSDSDVIVVDEPVPKRPTRSRSRLTRKKAEMDQKEKEPSEPDTSQTPVSQKTQPPTCKDTVDDSNSKPIGQIGMLWTDKYCPGSSSEIIGNSRTVKKIKSWLEEWRQRTDVEARKLRKQQVREAKKAGKSAEEIKKSFGDDWWDDDSDFDLDSESSDDSSDDEDDSLCNTVLLTGQNGIGKSSLVHALAKDLGYKVFEVNAASRRNGKQILSQLQEATQSHQVSKKNLDAMYTTAMMMEKNGAALDVLKLKAADTKKKPPAAFANFFGKGKKNGAPETPEQPKSKTKSGKSKEKKKRDKGKKTSKSPATKVSTNISEEKKKGLDLASTSLILFEEVDIVFEEDKGFWCAVQTFMATTKRPILLTANDPKFGEKFRAKMEHYNLRAPTAANLASYLQVISLVENMRTDYNDLLMLAEHYKCDVRASLLALQYWCMSGASESPLSKPVQYRKKFFKDKTLLIGPGGDGASPLKPMSSPKLQLPVKNYDSADDFEVARPRSSRSRRLIIDDESSNDALSPMKSLRRPTDSLNLSMIEEEGELSQQSQASSQEDLGVDKPQDLLLRPVDKLTPSLHTTTFETVTCMRNQVRSSDNYANLKQMIMTDDIQALGSTLSVMRRIQADVLYANIPRLLSLPNCPFSRLKRPKPVKPTQTTRILNKDDLFDSEASDDGFPSLKKKPEIVALDTPVKADCENANSGMEVPTCDSVLCQKSLDSLARMYDNYSSIDLLSGKTMYGERCHAPRHVWNKGRIAPGDSDSLARIDSSYDPHKSEWLDLLGAVESRTFARADTELKQIVKNIEELDQEKLTVTKQSLSLPVDNQSDNLLMSQEKQIHLQLRDNAQRAICGIARSLPLHVMCQKKSVTTDYLPTVRTIFLSEQCRKAEKTKRRFFHYLDEFMKELKDADVDTLCSSFD